MPRELTERYYQAVDSSDAGAVAAFFADQGRFTFANQEPRVSPAAIEQGLKAMYSSIEGLSHRIVQDWYPDADTIVEHQLTVTRLDGEQVTVPVAAHGHLDSEDKIDDERVFIDLAPVFFPGSCTTSPQARVRRRTGGTPRSSTPCAGATGRRWTPPTRSTCARRARSWSPRSSRTASSASSPVRAHPHQVRRGRPRRPPWERDRFVPVRRHRCGPPAPSCPVDVRFAGTMFNEEGDRDERTLRQA